MYKLRDRGELVEGQPQGSLRGRVNRPKQVPQDEPEDSAKRIYRASKDGPPKSGPARDGAGREGRIEAHGIGHLSAEQIWPCMVKQCPARRLWAKRDEPGPRRMMDPSRANECGPSLK